MVNKMGTFYVNKVTSGPLTKGVVAGGPNHVLEVAWQFHCLFPHLGMGEGLDGLIVNELISQDCTRSLPKARGLESSGC